MNNMSVLVVSCDKNSDIWKPFNTLYKKYWKHDYKTYIITETKDCEYFETIKKQGSWTSRVRQALEKIKSDNVIILLDDFFIRQPVNQDVIDNIVMCKDTAVYNFEKTYVGNGFELRENKTPYLCSCQPSMWNRKILIELLQKDMTPHEWEMQLIDSKYDFYINTTQDIIDIGYYNTNRTHWGIVQGKWTRDVAKLFKKENIEIDYSKREFFGNIKLSIIIPYYKTLDMTKRLLDVLCEQLNDSVEVILVDDGCNELELDKYPIRVIHQENKGVSSARNKGLNMANGKYIAFIDSDDMISADYVDKILNKIDTVSFDYCMFSWRGIGRIKGDFIITEEAPKWNTSIWNCVYKKELIENTRFNENKQIGEDEEFNIKVRRGIRANITDILYTYYTERTDNLTGRYMHKEITDTVNNTVDNKIKAQIIVYQKSISKIGGVETWLYEFFKEYNNKYEILFVYSDADKKQLFQYQLLVKCIKFNNQQFECDKYICASNQNNIADNVTSKDKFYALIIQADYKAMNWSYRQHPKTNVHIAVSEVAKKGIDIKGNITVIYNLLKLNKPKRVLNLISCTRMSKEKGYDKMQEVAKRLESKYPYIWTVFTDNVPAYQTDGLCIRQSVLDDTDYIANADYYFTCSKTESWGYSTAKALELGIPVVALEYPALYEQGLIDGVNGYIIKQDLSNLNEVLDKMYNNDLKGFNYNKLDNPKQWDDLLKLPKKKSNYKYKEQTEWQVKALVSTFYTQEGIHANKGDIFVVKNKERLEELLDYCGKAYIEIV